MFKSKTSSPEAQYKFGGVNKKVVIGRFDGGDISPDGGMLLLSRVDADTGLSEMAAQSLEDRRKPEQVRHALANIIRQRMLLIACGYEDGNDVQHQKDNPMLKLALGQNPGNASNLASQPTLSRFENAFGPKDLYRLSGVLVEQYIATKGKAPRRVVLDFDGTCIEAHGAQQLTLLRGFYQARIYFPLMVFDQDGWLLAAVLRPGDHGDVRIALPVLKRLVKRLRKAWPQVEIVFRGDAAFHSPSIFDWCEDNDVFYVVAHPSNHALNVNAEEYVYRAAHRFRQKYGQQRYVCKDAKQQKRLTELKTMRLPSRQRYALLKEQVARRIRVFGEFHYQAGMGSKQWRQERRFVCVCDVTDEGLERRYVITNLKELPQHVYEQFYCKRGRAEMFIKEMKSLKCTKLSCREFYANQLRLLLFALAYTLLHQFRQLLPVGYRKSTLPQVQRQWLKVAVQVKETARAIWLRWTTCFPYQRQYFALCRRTG